MKYIIIDDNKMEYMGDINEVEVSYVSLKLNEFAFKFNGNIYPYRGVGDNSSLDITEEFGLYYNLDDSEFVIIGDSKYTEEDLLEESEGFTLDDSLLKNIKN